MKSESKSKSAAVAAAAASESVSDSDSEWESKPGPELLRGMHSAGTEGGGRGKRAPGVSSVSRIKHESLNVAVAVVPVMAECLAWAAVPVGHFRVCHLIQIQQQQNENYKAT